MCLTVECARCVCTDASRDNGVLGRECIIYVCCDCECATATQGGTCTDAHGHTGAQSKRHTTRAMTRRDVDVDARVPCVVFCIRTECVRTSRQAIARPGKQMLISRQVCSFVCGETDAMCAI